MSTPDPIWVGIDGSGGSTAAVRFAAHSAGILDVGVHLLYVIPPDLAMSPMSPMFPLVPAEMEPMGRKLLADAVQVAAVAAPSVPVTTSLHHGQRASALVEASERARFLVLGRARRSTAERLLTGSVATAVSARSTGSVVVVPAGWTAPEDAFHVVVGMKSPDHSAELALRAMRLAADRGGRVTFVHAWDLPSQYDDLISARIGDQAWVQRDHDVITSALHEVTALYSEVPVDIRVVHGQAARVLQQESEAADLLLLARRDHLFPRGHLGGTARALLRESSCPVEVVPPAEGPSDPAVAFLESAGATSR